MSEQFEIVDLGVHHPDYFGGFGVSYTRFDFCTYGIAYTAEEAYQDALDSMAQSGEHAQAVIELMPEHCPFKGSVDCDGPYYHVGIRWNKIADGDV